MIDKLQNCTNQMLLTTQPYLNPTPQGINSNQITNQIGNSTVKYQGEYNVDADELVGNYKIAKIDSDKYAVSLTNGNLGAKVCTKDEVDELKKQIYRQNYSNSQVASENYNRALINLNKNIS